MKGSIFAFVIILFGIARGEIYFPSSYKAVEIPQNNCPFAVEAAFLVDVTSRTRKNPVSIRNEVMRFFDYLRVNPENRLGVGSFSDKPVAPLGFNRDYCLKIHSIIEDVKNDREVEEFMNESGYDVPQAQFDAMLRAVKGKKFGWTEKLLTPTGTTYFKAVFVVTDGPAHVSPDLDNAVNALKLPISVVPNTLAVNPFLIATDLNAECGIMEYPTLNQVGDVLRAEGIVPVFLIAPAGYDCGAKTEKICAWPEFEDLAKKTNNSDYLDPMKGMDLLYKSYLDEMNIPGIVQHLDFGFQGLFEKLEDTYREMHKFPRYCNTTSTTTQVPPTTIPTTIPTTMESTMKTTMKTTMPTTTTKFKTQTTTTTSTKYTTQTTTTTSTKYTTKFKTQTTTTTSTKYTTQTTTTTSTKFKTQTTTTTTTTTSTKYTTQTTTTTTTTTPTTGETTCTETLDCPCEQDCEGHINVEVEVKIDYGNSDHENIK